MTKYKVGIIGCGRVASLLENDHLRPHPCTHAGAYAAIPKYKLWAACDIDKVRLKYFGEVWGVKKLYTDYAKMLENEDLDVVSICTWTESHAEICVKAANSGVKGILCEKPMALNLSQADQMIKACKQNNVKLVITHNRRWYPIYQRVKDAIREGLIGEVRTVVGNVLTDKPPGDWHADYKGVGGGPLLHDGTHLMDMLRFLVGEVDWVFGHIEKRSKDITVEDVACAFLHFKNDAHAIVEGGGLRKYFNFELDIQGSEGRILIGNACATFWRTEKSQRYVGFQELSQKPFPTVDNHKNPHIICAEELIECIEEDKESISNGYDGRAALELVMAIYNSARLNGQKVYLPLNMKESPLELMLKQGQL
jgi:predicted dehydrogenase